MVTGTFWSVHRPFCCLFCLTLLPCYLLCSTYSALPALLYPALQLCSTCPGNNCPGTLSSAPTVPCFVRGGRADDGDGEQKGIAGLQGACIQQFECGMGVLGTAGTGRPGQGSVSMVLPTAFSLSPP